MAPKRVWSPAEGPQAAPQQIPARSGRVSGSGVDDRSGRLWAPSGGPVRSDPGGGGGEPDGRTAWRPGQKPFAE